MILTLDGHSAYAYTAGKAFDAAQPTLLFVHGAQNDHSVWALQSRWFAHHGVNALALDLPGHQRSAGPPCKTVEGYADWVLRFAQAAGAQRFAIAGHSMGSLIALECAARAPERVTQLALIGTAYPMKVSPELLQTSLDDPGKAMRMVNAWSIGSLAPKPSAPGPGAWLHGGGLRLMQRVQRTQPAVNVFHNDFVACHAYANGEAACAKVQCPVLFVLGERDMMTPPRAARALQAALPQSRTVLLRCGHHLMGEQPDGVLAALRGLVFGS
jgi:pimeloyl-ACP methyl ester carboxylesterase